MLDQTLAGPEPGVLATTFLVGGTLMGAFVARENMRIYLKS